MIRVNKYFMLRKTNFSVSPILIDQALSSIQGQSFKQAINRPTGNFFYDPWELCDEYRNTAIETIYQSLPSVKGEARIITLTGAESYFSHSDIDDRWHLNLCSKNAYLIDLDNREMFPLNKDGCWYEMNAGKRHTAANFGNRPRVQLVVRKLLKRSRDPSLLLVKIITKITDLEDARYEFDDKISPLLNQFNKLGLIDNFSPTQSVVEFNTTLECVDKLRTAAGQLFEIVI